MELVYLWVEDYKNIKEEGFNFSPRFTCNYDKDSNKLTIDENKEHVSIFPENINITAIVGENGSGKSSVMLFLMKKLFDKNYDKSIDKAFFLVVNIKGKLVLYKDNIHKIINSIPQYYIYEEKNKKTIKETIFFQFIDFSLTNNILNSYEHYKKNFAIEPSVEYRGSGPGYISKISSISFESIMMGKSVFLYKYIDNEILDNLKIENFNEIKLSDTRYKKNSKYENFKKEIDELKKFYEKKPDRILLKIFSKQYFELCLENKNFNGKNTKIRLSDLEEEDLLYLPLLERFVTINLTNEKNISYRDLSGGHKIFIGYFALIYKQLITLIKENKKKTFYVIIDEIEMALHPKWQKNIMSFLIKSIEKIIMNKDIFIYFIPITHSPFVISDLPKENIIFLERLKNGECKNISTNIEIEQTFGANIHTLLSNGFFMENGLMGEFAKGKIKEIIDFHKSVELEKDNKTKIEEFKKDYLADYDKKKNRFWHIQSIIGEDYLKQVVKNHILEIEKLLYEDKYIDSEIERVKQELKKLEAVKNAKS